MTSPTEILEIIPYLIGFHPESSLVVVNLHGPRRRAGLVIRADLPPIGAAGWARELAARVEAEAPAGVLLVCYTEQLDDHEGLPHRGVVAELAGALSAAAELEIVESLLVRAGSWWSYHCSGPCCPADGTPLDPGLVGSSPTSVVAAAAAVAGRAVLMSRSELVRSVAGPTGDHLSAMEQAIESAAAQLAVECANEGAAASARRTVTLVEESVDRFGGGVEELSDDAAARLLLGLADTQARDRVAASAALGNAAWPAMLVRLAARAPDGVAAPVCTTLAWVAYQNGDGALANVALDRALDSDPGYAMAQLLRDSLNSQLSPEVIRAVTQRADRPVIQRSGPAWPAEPDCTSTGPRREITAAPHSCWYS